MFSIALQELRFACRGLLRSPWFTLTTVGMLAIGLGLTMFMFGAIQSFMLRPPLPGRVTFSRVWLSVFDPKRA